MASFKTHLHALAERVATQSSLPIFKLPVYDGEGQLRAWAPISSSQFQSDVEHFAAHLTSKLAAEGITPRSVIGLW